MARRRGRPPRADVTATERIELRLTLPELRAIRELARANGTNVADTLRLAVLEIAAETGARPPIVLGRTLLARITAGSNSRRAPSSKEGSTSSDEN